MIQSSSQIANCVTSDKGALIDHFWPTQPEFVSLVSGFRVCFNDYFVRVFGVESYYPALQVLDVMLCPSDF